MRILQFVYALPPHIGGLEQIVEQFSEGFVVGGYGDVLTITSSLGQHNTAFEYHKNGLTILIMPSFALIENYPVPKFWKRDFWKILGRAKKFKADIIQVHMRFFLFSLLGWLLSKIWNLPLVLVEHSSDFANFSFGIMRFFGRIYDYILVLLMYRTSNIIIATSEICKKFIQKFTSKKIEVIYRGIDKYYITPINNISLKNKFPDKIIVGFVGRLVYWKNVHTLISAYYKLDKELQEKIQLCIIGGGEEYKNLKKLDIGNQVYFTGEIGFQEAINYQSQFDIYVHSSSQGGALAGTLLQAMALGNLIVATPYEGANEVIKNMENGILLHDDSLEELVFGIKSAINILNKKNKWKKINQNIIHEKFDRKNKLEEFYLVYKKIIYIQK